MNDNYLWDRTGEPDPELQKLEEVLGTLRFRNDNYLWDRSGEPDIELQKLEQVLGTLRYQPRPFEIPADIRIARKPNYFPLAIAAAIALLVIGAGLWFQLSRSQSAPVNQARREAPTAPAKDETPQPKQLVIPGGSETTTPRPETGNMLAVNRKHRAPRVFRPEPALTPEQLAEKAQVIDALRLVSAKLNLAQRKVQGLPQKNIFRNQNKIG